MAADGFFSLARAKIDTVTKRFDKSAIFDSISRLAAGVDVSEFFSELACKEKLGLMETFQKFSDDLIWTFINWRFKLSAQEKPDDKKGAVVIFIDDLDRCNHHMIVQVLETIKLYMDRCGYIFVIGACAENIQQALRKDQDPQDARSFLEKIIQVHFALPHIFPEEFADLINEAKYDNGDAQVIKSYLPMIMPALEYNPRQLKRFLNSLNLLNGLVHTANIQIRFDKVLAWGLIFSFFRDFAADIKDKPEHLFELRNQIQQLSNKFGEMPVWQLNQQQLGSENVPEFLHAHLQHRHLSEIVMHLDITPEQLRCLHTLSHAVLSPRQ